MEQDLDELPEPPTRPLDSECCGNGCTPCVFDIYDEEMEQWRKLCTMSREERAATLMNKETQQLSVTDGLSLSHYSSLKISDIVRVTDDTCIYRFSLAPNSALNMKAGQHLVLRIRNDDGTMVTRQYTPISRLNQRDYFEVIIKLYPDGIMSQHIDQWSIGTCAEWKGPFGSFSYTPNKFDRIGMLACGTGIAPMVQVIRQVVENENDDTRVHLVYGCRTQRTILQKEFLDECNQFWNFSVLYSLSNCTEQQTQEHKGLLRYQDKVHYGRIDMELVKTEMPVPSPKHCVLICGTKSFDKDMINYLLKLGYTKSMYFKF